MYITKILIISPSIFHSLNSCSFPSMQRLVTFPLALTYKERGGKKKKKKKAVEISVRATKFPITQLKPHQIVCRSNRGKGTTVRAWHVQHNTSVVKFIPRSVHERAGVAFPSSGSVNRGERIVSHGRTHKNSNGRSLRGTMAMFLRAGTPTNRSQRVVNRASRGASRSRFRADPKIFPRFLCFRLFVT